MSTTDRTEMSQTGSADARSEDRLRTRKAQGLNWWQGRIWSRAVTSAARNYLGLLRAVFLVVAVPAWTTSFTTRIVRASKLFLVDSGLTAHVQGLGHERLGG